VAGRAEHMKEQAVEREIANDMVRRALPIAPAVAIAVGLAFGRDAGLSAAFAIGLVLANFLVAALSLAWAAERGPAVLMGTALFGFILRLAAITTAVLLVHGQGWVEVVPLGFTLIVAHLGLLFWETRFVSASLAYPGLRPTRGGG
jgi:hypothetical protein